MKQSSSFYAKVSFDGTYGVSEASISFNDNDEKCVDLAELLGIDIYDFKDSSLVEDCIVDAYNTSGIL